MHFQLNYNMFQIWRCILSEYIKMGAFYLYSSWNMHGYVHSTNDEGTE